MSGRATSQAAGAASESWIRRGGVRPFRDPTVDATARPGPTLLGAPEDMVDEAIGGRDKPSSAH